MTEMASTAIGSSIEVDGLSNLRNLVVNGLGESRVLHLDRLTRRRTVVHAFTTPEEAFETAAKLNKAVHDDFNEQIRGQAFHLDCPNDVFYSYRPDGRSMRQDPRELEELPLK